MVSTLHALLVFLWQSKMVKECLVVLAAVNDLRLCCLFALNSTIDNVNSGSKVWADSSLQVSCSRHKETSHCVVHTWLRVLRSHVEPESCSKDSVRVLMNDVWVPQKVHVTIVRCVCERFRECSVVVVPRKLEWSSAVVLDSSLGWVCFAPFATFNVVATWFASIWSVKFFCASDLSDPIQSLFPLWLAL